MPRIGFTGDDDERSDQPDVIPLYADNPNAEPGWWDDEDDEEWEV